MNQDKNSHRLFVPFNPVNPVSVNLLFVYTSKFTRPILETLCRLTELSRMSTPPSIEFRIGF